MRECACPLAQASETGWVCVRVGERGGRKREGEGEGGRREEGEDGREGGREGGEGGGEGERGKQGMRECTLGGRKGISTSQA